LVGAMNPCPCGEGVLDGRCHCTDVTRARYARRLSAPLLDRFDLVVPLARPEPDLLLSQIPSPSSAQAAARVLAARSRATQRLEAGGDPPPMRPDAAKLIATRLRAGQLSARGMVKVSRVARTVADLLGSDDVTAEHVSDALSLRKGRELVTR
jgi:magnesium chelatase family protein